MTEQEYINATNLAKISAALTILKTVDHLDVHDFGVDLLKARIKIKDIESYLSDLIDLQESE